MERGDEEEDGWLVRKRERERNGIKKGRGK